MKLLFSLGILFIVFGFYEQTDKEVIFWSKDKLLTWDNFKGIPDTTTLHAAVTDCHIKTNFKTKKDTLYINIASYMNPSLSWAKTKERNVNLLKHEQVHFDITELYARKLRQEVLSRKFPKIGIAIELKKMADNNIQAFKQCQTVYDNETDHSKIKLKQDEWQKKIAKELKGLEAYNSSEIKVVVFQK